MSKFDGILAAKTIREAKPKQNVKQESKLVAPPIKKKTVGRRSDPDYTQITAYVKKDMHKQVMKEIYQEMELSELVDSLLTEWLKGRLHDNAKI